MINQGEIFLSWKYLKPKFTLISVITYLSFLGPIIGVCLPVFFIAIMNGFPVRVIEKIIDFESHMTVERQYSDQKFSNPEDFIEKIDQKYGIKGSPTHILPVFIQNGDQVKTLLAKGFDPYYDKEVSNLKSKIISGRYEISNKEILISRSIAYRHNLGIGSKIYLHSPDRYAKMIKAHNQGESPDIQINPAVELRVGGIFSFGLHQVDSAYVYIHLDTANSLSGDYAWGESKAIDLRLSDPQQSLSVRDMLKSDRDFAGYRYLPWQDKQGGFVNIIQQEKGMVKFVLFFLLAGAAVGIAACIFSLVLQKVHEIGILKSVGVSAKSIVLIFMFQGTFIGVCGSFIGYYLGKMAIKYRMNLLNGLETITGQEIFPKEFYQLDGLPALEIPSDNYQIICGSIIVCILASLIPALIAASIKPAKALQAG